MAVKNNLLLSNPCELVTLPQQKPYESTFYSTEQMAHLLDAIRDEPLYPLVKVTAFYGLRRSELLGLKWDSIRFDTNTITIRHTVVKVTDVVEKEKIKNQTSHRTFPLVPEIRELLLSVKAAEEQNRRAFGKDYDENDYVFKWENGKPYSPDYVSHKFHKLLQQYGLPPIRFHELRHSCASILLEQGYSLRDIQEWLGHADIRMNSRYSHLDISRKKKIAESMAKSFPERC